MVGKEGRAKGGGKRVGGGKRKRVKGGGKRGKG